MDKPIAVGDLVAVVKWPHKCLPKPEKGVSIFTVQAITAINPKCPRCNEQIEVGQPSAWYDLTHSLPIPWLKRIPPLNELESTKTDEPMKEPA